MGLENHSSLVCGKLSSLYVGSRGCSIHVTNFNGLVGFIQTVTITHSNIDKTSGL